VLVVVVLLALPLLVVMFLAERGLWQQRTALRKTMTASDRRTGRVVALTWFVSLFAVAV
jgi:hypothetical protein